MTKTNIAALAAGALAIGQQDGFLASLFIVAVSLVLFGRDALDRVD